MDRLFKKKFRAIAFIAFVFPINSFSYEGFNRLNESSLHKVIKTSVVKISIKKKWDFISTDWKEKYIDDDGFIVETWAFGKDFEPNHQNCSNKNFRSYNYFDDACEYLGLHHEIRIPIEVKFSASGYFTDFSGKIVTAKHLVKDCKMYYKGRFPFYCPILNIEVVENNKMKIIEGASILAWSKSRGSDGELDYALLDINFKPENILQTCAFEDQLEDEILVFGFPVTSNRGQGSGYVDADGTLLLSRGKIFRDLVTNTDNFLFTDADAVGGNSGGPAMSSRGCVLGNMTRISHQGDPTTDNINTMYMLSKENPAWISKSSKMCSELSVKSIAKYVKGCVEH